MIYHQNIQLSMKQEAQAAVHLGSVEGFSHCQASVTHWRCTSPHEHAILQMMPTVRISFCAALESGHTERVYTDVRVCVCVCEEMHMQKDMDRVFTAEIKMESILVLEAFSSTV